MRRLYVRIVSGVALAVVAGWIAVGLFLPRVRGLLERGLADQVIGSGLGAVGAKLDAASASEWPRQLSQAQGELTIPLKIVAAESLSPAVTSGLSSARPTTVRTGNTPSIFIPLHGGSHFLVAGPLPPPPVAPFAAVALVFVVVLTVTASAAVGIPLVRRLRSLRHAIGELGGGNWAVRLDANAEGALSDLAESINRMAVQLQQQFREREALLQAVSHEMGTPLSRMRFQVALLEEELERPEQRKRLQALSEDLTELDELSTELVSWMEIDGEQHARRDFEIGSVLESLVELECQRTGPPLDVALVAPSGVRVHADQRLFQRAVENLLRNAVRYAQRRLVVEAAGCGAEVLVEVRDDGPGIPPEQRTRVLEPFFRVNGPSSQAHRGLGLGLAIVRRIVEAHGGTVVVTDAPEGGTTVRTTWPQGATAAYELAE